MKLGSVEHKDLFCRSFTESYREYEPEYLPWPDLDDTALTFLRSIPFWEMTSLPKTSQSKNFSTFVYRKISAG
ncbi:hypothetical protein [Nostoc sp.]|uniref:hypothetical protein n=1 Tax=Nostoc sp. TaxID=1180 RepID=UPI002FF692EF